MHGVIQMSKTKIIILCVSVAVMIVLLAVLCIGIAHNRSADDPLLPPVQDQNTVPSPATEDVPETEPPVSDSEDAMPSESDNEPQPTVTTAPESVEAVPSPTTSVPQTETTTQPTTKAITSATKATTTKKSEETKITTTQSAVNNNEPDVDLDDIENPVTDAPISEAKPATTTTVSAVTAQPTYTPTYPTPSTAPTTEPTTAPTTEPVTEPSTEPTTAPETPPEQSENPGSGNDQPKDSGYVDDDGNIGLPFIPIT